MSNDPLLPSESNAEPTPAPLPSDPSPSSPASPQTPPTGVPPNIAAALSVFTFGIAGVVFLMLEKNNRFVRFWAMQSIFFGVAMVVLGLVAGIVFFILAHLLFFLAWITWFLFMLIRLGIFILWIVMLVQAFSGKEWEIPVLGKMAREQLAKMDSI